MSLPLYDVVQQTPPALTSDSHHGLWFDRFFNQYEAGFSIAKSKKIEGKDQSPRAFWLIESFVKNKQSIGNVTALTHYFNQQNQLIEALNGQKQAFKASWHFVTGMGNPHPVENGFAWHPTLGVPYLTGAAVKGLIRAYIENHLDADDKSKKELLLNWFGSTSKQPNDKDYQAQGGTLIFFDALPTQPVTLGVDIMTPHMGDWYADGAKAQKVGTPDAVPADWHDPVPVTFLVAKEITLLFSFALRPTAPPQDKAAIKLDDVAYVLEQALQYAGAGAKTATGYGQMQSLAALETMKQQATLQDAEIVEAYLKRNLKNKSLLLEHQRKPIATLTNQDKVTEILNQLDNLNQQKIAKGEGVKVKAYVMNKEIIQLVKD